MEHSLAFTIQVKALGLGKFRILLYLTLFQQQNLIGEVLIGPNHVK